MIFTEKPEITVYEKELIVSAGDPAILKCSSKGIPPPMVTWNRGNVEVFIIHINAALV